MAHTDDYARVIGDAFVYQTAADGTPTITVTSEAEYSAAMQSLKATGGTVLVDTSNGAFRLDTHRVDAESRILVTSADPENPAEILGMKVSRSSNITFTGLEWPPVDERDGPEHAAFFQTSSNIEFVGNTIRGSAYGKLGIDTMHSDVGGGVGMRGCEDMTVANNVIDGTKSGIFTSNCTNTVLQGNILTGMQGDVFRVVSSVDTLVDRNVVDKLFGSSGDMNHPDILQYYDNRADAPVVGLTITNNYFNSGDTSYQGIYGGMNRDSGPYLDIRIENNLIITGSQNGVKIGYFDGVIIRNNTLLYNEDAVSHKTMDTEIPVSSPPQFSVYSGANIEVSGNIGVFLIRDPANDNLSGSVVFENNFELEYYDRTAANYIDRIFVNVGCGGEKDLRDFQVIAGSGAEGFGATLAQIPDFDVLSISTTHIANMPQAMEFSALCAQDGAVYTWTTSDGRVFEGAQVTIGFADAGSHNVTLTVETAGGVTESLTRQVNVRSAVLFDFDPNTGFPEDYGRQTVYSLTGEAEIGAAEDGSGRMVLDLDPTDTFAIARGLDIFKDMGQFSILLDFRQQAPEGGGHIQSAGSIFYKRAGFMIAVDPDGTLHVTIRDADGTWHEAMTEPGALMDTEWHSLALSYNGFAGDASGLSVRLDDVQVAHVAMSGTIDLSDRPIQIGAAFGNVGIDAEIGGLRVIDAATTSDSQIRDPLSLLAPEALTGIVETPPEEIAMPEDTDTDTDTDGDADTDTAGTALEDDDALADSLLEAVNFRDVAAEDGKIGGFTVVQGRNGPAIDLNGADRQSFSLGDLSALEGNTAFTVATALRVDDLDVQGRIIFVRGLFSMSVARNGTLDLRTTLVDDDGQPVVNRTLIDSGVTAQLADGDFHRVVVSYSGEAGTLSVWIGGDLVSESALQGSVPSIAQSMIGNTWGSSFDGAVESVSIFATAVDADAVTADHLAYVDLPVEMPMDDGGIPAPSYLSLLQSSLGESLVLSEDFENALDPDVDADGFPFVQTEQGTLAIAFSGETGQSFRLEGIEQLEGSDAFTIATSLRVHDFSEGGRILSIRGLFDLSVNNRGELDWSTTLTDEDGQTMRVRNALGGEIADLLSDGEMHRVVASYGAEAAEVSLWIDGKLVDSAPISGGIDSIRQALLGNPWGEVFDGAVDDIAIFRQAADATLIENDYMAFSTTEFAY